jgi:hypothetical protein
LDGDLETADPAMSFDSFPIWQEHRTACCDRIRKVRAFIKIILITKNDPYFIERWITHHIKIAGIEGLVIFDNMSDDPKVLAVYEKYRDRINIMRFAGNHNGLHNSAANDDLYRAIAGSSTYCIFSDTDEFLILIDGDRYYDDHRVANFVGDNANYSLFPTTWLLNANWSDTQFHGVIEYNLARLLALGKPLIRSDRFPPGYINHNFQLSTRWFVPPFRANLFLIHLVRFIPRQRINSNVNKLIARGAAQPGETPESIAARTDFVGDVQNLYARQIREYLLPEISSEPAGLGPSQLELLPDGTVSYFSDAERQALNTFIRDPKPVYDLIVDPYVLDSIIGG